MTTEKVYVIDMMDGWMDRQINRYISRWIGGWMDR